VKKEKMFCGLVSILRWDKEIFQEKKELGPMKKNNPGEKRVLIVDEDPDILDFLAGETRKICLSCQFEKADTFSQAVDSMFSGKYDLVILDFPGIRGPYLLNLALLREIPVVVLVSFNSFSIEANHLFQKGIKGLLPKKNLSEIGPVLENLLSPKNPPAFPCGPMGLIS
jgi:CheY-like chemotaxis protein